MEILKLKYSFWLLVTYVQSRQGVFMFGVVRLLNQLGLSSGIPNHPFPNNYVAPLHIYHNFYRTVKESVTLSVLCV